MTSARMFQLYPLKKKKNLQDTIGTKEGHLLLLLLFFEHLYCYLLFTLLDLIISLYSNF